MYKIREVCQGIRYPGDILIPVFVTSFLYTHLTKFLLDLLDRIQVLLHASLFFNATRLEQE